MYILHDEYTGIQSTSEELHYALLTFDPSNNLLIITLDVQ